METGCPFISVAEAASWLGISPGSIRRAISLGRIRGYRIAPRGKLLLKREDLVSLIETPVS